MEGVDERGTYWERLGALRLHDKTGVSHCVGTGSHVVSCTFPFCLEYVASLDLFLEWLSDIFKTHSYHNQLRVPAYCTN